MSTFTIEKLQDEPIIVWSTLDEWDWERDMPEASHQVARTLDAQTAPVFWVSDIRNASMSLDEAIFTANFLAKDTKFHEHVNIREILIVTPNMFVKLAAKGLKSASFGNMPVRVFDTFEEAVAYARSLIEHK